MTSDRKYDLNQKQDRNYIREILGIKFSKI